MSENTRSKLDLVKEKLHDFERVLQQESHQRLSKREVEQKKLQAFQDALDCFEDRINEEMAARSRTVKELVLDVERQLSAFKHELVALLDDQKTRMQEPAERIQNRLVLLERETEKVDVSSLKTELVRDVQTQIKDLKGRLAGIVEDGVSVGDKFDTRVKRFENDLMSGLAREKVCHWKASYRKPLTLRLQLSVVEWNALWPVTRRRDTSSSRDLMRSGRR
ncbi:MAG: uncharacterized protein KVP18_001057 [Porospora cf. gigantea A]|uniref:uncharacterized protein n=1 Tax=Porospora cf. gigantea A TaxID=2853593 RepID=UPI003559762D|nr:MAG: hypothetical protein KVP18_001057 [Porospora cf. gigantea A]